MDGGSAYCTSCGHLLGVGRFCTNCGQPIAGRHSDVATAPTVTTPAQSVPVVPAAGVAPPPARYPLFADEATPPGPPAAPPSPLPPPPSPSPSAPRSQRDRRWLVWVAILSALVAIVALGIVLLISGDDGEKADDTTTTAELGDGEGRSKSGPRGGSDPGDTGDLTREATATAPVTAPDSTDQQTGEPVTFAVANMLDGDPTTAWRMPGDGTGTELTFSFDEPVEVTEVGLINGYAKVYPGYNGYQWNRRIVTVEWVFDDGSSVIQHLRSSRRVQSTSVGPTTTSTIRLRIVEVTPVPRVPAPKDYTPISEIAIGGTDQA